MPLFQANRDFGNLKWFRRTVSNAITKLGDKIGSSRNTLTERQGFAGPFFVPFAIGSIIFSGKISLIQTKLVFFRYKKV